MRWLLPFLVVLLWVHSECRLMKDSGVEEDSKYKVVRIVPKNEIELGVLKKIYKTAHDFDLDFWKGPTGVNQFVDIMVAPTFSDSFDQFLHSRNMTYVVTIDDVQKRILMKEKPRSSIDASLNPLLRDFFGKRMHNDFTSRNTAKYGFGDYHSYDTMVNWMNEIERNYPNMAKVFTLGVTYEGRAIKGIKIGSPVTDTSKRIVWIDGGMHAREWAAIHTALWFIDQLIANYGVDPQITGYVDTLNFYITPVVNPDGFEYSRSEANPQTRFWRKNRGEQICKKDRWRRERCCGGVDLNRNFDFHFGETGSSEDLCSEIYQGKSAFSEPESRAVRDKMFSAELYGKVDAFITLHTYSQMWIHPFNHERRSFPNDIFDLQTVGRKGVKAIESMYGTKFKFGTGADILYPSAGGSDDWAKAKAHVKYVYLLELRPGEDEWDGFLLDRRQLIPTARETWEGIKVVIDAVMGLAQRYPKTITHAPFSATTPTTTFSTTQATTTTQSTTVFFTTTNPPPALPPSPPPTFSPNPLPVFQPNPPPVLPVNPAPAFNPNNPTPTFQPQPSQPRQTDVDVRIELQKKLEAARQRQVAARREYERRLRLFEAQREAANRLREQQARAQWQLQQTCMDRSPWCANWIAQSPNICRASSIYMRQDCARSCGYCRSF